MNTALPAIFSRYAGDFHPLVPFNPANEKIISLDLTAGNTALTDELLADTGLFTAYINSALKQADARYAMGGYNELRTVYRNSTVFDAANDKSEPRRLHLGTDIWGRHGTPVMAPLDGLLHSFAYNNRKGDYGATIILTHRLEEQTFFTLYGHLSLASLGNKQEGQRIRKGDVFAEFGIPAENGQWPPHLHFQVIKEIAGYYGDYPGVCAVSEKDKWLTNSPDPELILQLSQYIRS